MKTTGQSPLPFDYAEGVSFTLPIQKKAVQSNLSPFSYKKLAWKERKEESPRQIQG